MANGDPTDPKGPGSQQPMPPIDPAVASVFERMAGALDLANQRATSSEKLLQAMAEHAGAVAEEAAKATVKLKDMFRLSDSIEENYKKIVEYGKKRSQQSIKEFQDAQKARKELEQIASLYEDALKNSKENTKESKTMSSHLKEIQKTLKSLPKDGELTKDQLQGVADAFERASRNAKDLVKAMSDLGRTGTTLKGMMGVLGSMGIGKGFNAAHDRKLEQIEEVKTAVKESREMRQAATRKHMGIKRGKAMDEMRDMAKRGGLTTDPDTGEVADFFDDAGGLTKGGRHVLARKMGFKPGTDKFGNFVEGEAAGGEAATGEAAAGWAGAMSEGGGALEGLATGIEGLTTGLMAAAPEIVIPLMILAEAIKILTSVFETYVKQNQEMEKSIGKGGLFTQPGVGGGSAFMMAREALTPKFGHGVELGVNFERNLALAGAMANAGYSPAESLFNGGNEANLAPGSNKEFMKGGVGEVQRIVMGAGRVGGLSDQEGVEQVIKLLGEYRETIASSEQFMAQLNKDTAAAGISTTKYLKIIDDVSSHFDKMGKSLDQVTGVMRELSRYGAVSSESLKDMMEFLSAGQAQTNTGNLATAAFTQQMMPKDILEGVRSAQKQTLSNYVDEYNAQAARVNGKPLNVDDIQSAIEKGDFTGAQGMANSMRGDLDKVADPTIKQSMTSALNKIQEQINRVSGVMSPDFLKRASSQGLYGENQADVLASLFSNIRTSSQFSGVSVAALMHGGGSASQTIALQQLMESLGIKGSAANAFEPLRRVGQNRINDLSAPGETLEARRKNAKLIFSEFYRGSKSNKAIAQYLTDQGIGKDLIGNGEDAIDSLVSTDKGVAALQGLFGKNLDEIAGSTDTQDKLLASTSEGNSMNADGLAAQIDQARAIGSRTQSVGDFLSNVLKPLLNDLISVVEEIATMISKFHIPGFGGGDPMKALDKQHTDMNQVSDAISTLGTNLDQQAQALQSFTKAHTDASGNMDKASKAQATVMGSQIQTGLDTLQHLQDIKDKGRFDSMTQQDAVMNAMKQIGAGNVSQGEVTINNYYSSSTTQDNSAPTTVGASPTEGAEAMKQSPAARKPTGFNSVDNR